MISDLRNSIGELLWLVHDLFMLTYTLLTLWTCSVSVYLLIDVWGRAALLRGWFGDAQLALRAFEGDPKLSTAIRAERLGAACRVSPQHEASSILILGDGPGARLLLARRVANWQGGIIAIGAHGFYDRAPFKDAVRFCPGERNSLRLNPMLMLQANPFAWREARVLAAGLIGADGYAAEILAAFMLDQLLTAPVTERHLAALRRRLFEPEARNLMGRVHLKLGEAAQAHPEIARLARRLAAQSEDTAKALTLIAQALRPWADGRIEMATRDLDMHLSDVACGGVSSLIIEAPPGDARHCQGLFAALAGLVVMQLTDAAKTDNQGRAKQSPVLLLFEDAALVPCMPLLRRRMHDLAACGVNLVVKSADMIDAAIALGAGSNNAAAAVEEFEAIAAAGPQETNTAQFLSDQGGATRLVHLAPIFAGSGIWAYLVWLLPYPCWPRTPRLPPEALERLKPLQTLLLQRQAKPKLRMLSSTPPDAETTWRAGDLPPAVYAWSAPPVPQPKTTLQRIREPAATARAAQTELPLPQSPEVLPPGPFSTPPPRRRPRKNR